MINAYPITAINSYQIHKDYYRVSAVRGITGGKTSTSRQPLDMPYDQLANNQFAQRAAQGLAESVQTAQDQLTTEALFQMERSPLKPYAQYRSQLQTYLPVPISGLLLDQRM